MGPLAGGGRGWALTGLPLAAHEGVAHEAGLAAADGVVVDDAAARVRAARAGAGVGTALRHARVVLRAVGRDDALGPALRRRAHVARLARAHGRAVTPAAHAVRAARRRLARVHGLLGQRWRWRNRPARHQRVAREAGRARAHGRVVRHVALGVRAACARARVGALVVEAGAVARALGVLHALGPAARVRVAVVARQARARARALPLAAHRVRPAW